MLAGLADWDGTHGEERRMGAAHAVANSAALVCEWKSWRARRKGRHLRGVLWSGAAIGIATGAGAIGGHLSYDRAVGVDREVPVAADGTWHRVGSVSELVLDTPHGATAGKDDAPIAVVRTRDGVCAMAAVCSHAGGPLAEGKVVGDGLECPWHASRFALRDGSVQRGRAVTPQPVYETRVDGDAVDVRMAADARSAGA